MARIELNIDSDGFLQAFSRLRSREYRDDDLRRDFERLLFASLYPSALRAAQEFFHVDAEQIAIDSIYSFWSHYVESDHSSFGPNSIGEAIALVRRIARNKAINSTRARNEIVVSKCHCDDCTRKQLGFDVVEFGDERDLWRSSLKSPLLVQVFDLLNAGYTTRDIADQIGISEQAVRKRIRRIANKLKSRVDPLKHRPSEDRSEPLQVQLSSHENRK